MKRLLRLCLPIASPFLIAGFAAGGARIFFSDQISAMMGGPALIEVEPSPRISATAYFKDVILVPFTIKNIRSYPVVLLGASTSCSCTVAEGLPLKLLPGKSGKMSLRVTVGAANGDGRFVRSANLYADHRGFLPELTVDVKVLFRALSH